MLSAQNATTLPPDSADAREYARLQRWTTVADVALGFAVLLVLLLSGWTFALRDATVRLGQAHYTLSLLLYIFAIALLTKVMGLPLEFYGFRLEHRFHLSNQKIGGWMADEVKGWLLGLVLGALLGELVYWLIRTQGERWWLFAWAAFMLFVVLMAQIAPVVLLPIFYKFIPLENQSLKERLVRLSERAGTRVRGVYEWKLSEKSKKANAALTGLGNTRRIILADTLLENYSDDEIEAVLAHELGHHVHKHIFGSIVVQAVISLVGFWAVARALEMAPRYWPNLEGPHDFANLPLLLLVASALSLLLVPAVNAYSRRNERQADLYCWKSITAIQPFISAMEKLAAQNLAETAPSRWVEVLFHSHPSISKRIAAARAFKGSTP
jgi:STE24 endopeptidase